MASQRQKAEIFKALHHAPTGFLMPNAWDPGSAIVLAQEGFPALGTTSAGIAFSHGKCDFQVPDPSLGLTRGLMFQCIRQIVNAVPLPVNGDLENGYGDRPETVAETVRLAIEAGLAGGNIEDHDPRLPDGLYDEPVAVKQGWMCCVGSDWMHLSTGVIGASRRYVMVVYSLQPTDDATARATITQAVKTIFPGGRIS